MVDKSGIWAKSSFGLTKGWIYAAKTPDGPLAYWAIAEEAMGEADVNRMLTDQIRNEIAHCLG